MWFRVASGVYLPSSELVGFFKPEVLPGPGGRKAGAVALMRDGGTVELPFGTDALAARYARAAGKRTILTDGEK